jgi:hypothetical protein
MKEKGFEWAAKVSSSPLPPREVWHSLNLQLYPSLFFGENCLSADPQVLDEAFHSVYYLSLSSLGVNTSSRALQLCLQSQPTTLAWFHLLRRMW